MMRKHFLNRINISLGAIITILVGSSLTGCEDHYDYWDYPNMYAPPRYRAVNEPKDMRATQDAQTATWEHTADVPQDPEAENNY